MPPQVQRTPEQTNAPTKQFDQFTSSTLWNLGYGLKPDDWDTFLPPSKVLSEWDNQHGLMSTLSLAKLESLAELDALLRCRPSTRRVTRMLALARGQPAQKRRLSCIDDVYCLRDRIQEHFTNRTLMAWSLCGQMARRILILLDIATFKQLVDIMNGQELDDIGDVCKGSLSEKAILSRLSRDAQGIERQNNFCEERSQGPEVNTAHPCALLPKLVEHVNRKDELAVQRTVYEYFDHRSFLPKPGEHHHQGIIGLALGLMHLGRYNESEVALNEALDRRTTANHNLLNVLFNSKSDWRSLNAFNRDSRILPEVMDVLKPLCKCGDQHGYEIDMTMEHRQLLSARLIANYNCIPLYNFYRQLCAVWNEAYVQNMDQGRVNLEPFNRAIRQMNWKEALHLADLTKYPELCKAQATLGRGDDLNRVDELLSNVDKDDSQAQLIKACMSCKYGVQCSEHLTEDHPYYLLSVPELKTSSVKLGCKLRRQLVQSVLAMGDEYTRYRCFYVWAWMLLSTGNGVRLNEALSFMLRAADGFDTLDEVGYQAKSWFLAAKLANKLGLIEERNIYSRRFRLLYEKMSECERLLFC